MLLYTDAELDAMAKDILRRKKDRKELFRGFLTSLTNLPYAHSSNNDVHMYFRIDDQQFNLWATTMRAYQETLEGGRSIMGAFNVLKALNELNGEV